MLFSVIPRIVVVAAFLMAISTLPFMEKRMDWPLKMVVLVCAFGALAFLILPGLFKSAYGSEFLIGAMLCDIAADSVPDTSQRVEAITLAPATGTPRHQIYNHPQCVSEIVGWLVR